MIENSYCDDKYLAEAYYTVRRIFVEEKFEKLSKKAQEKEVNLCYLAKILIGIYLDKKA